MTTVARVRRISPINTTPNNWTELHATLRQVDGGLSLCQQNIDDQVFVHVPEQAYFASPISTSQIYMKKDLSLQILPGLPLLFALREGGRDVPYYAVVDAITATALSIRGAPMNDLLTTLYLSYAVMAGQLEFYIAGDYGDDVASLLLTDLSRYFRWGLSRVRIVSFAARHVSDATLDNPWINVHVDGQPVSTNGSNLGIQPGTSWVQNPAVAIDTDNYLLDRGSALEIQCTQADNAGGGSHASDLSIVITFVYESRDLGRILTSLE